MVDTAKAKQIPGWMLFEELDWLATQAQSHSCIVEMGSFLGRSTRALGDHTPGKVYALDSWIGPIGPNTKPVDPSLNTLSASGEYTEEEKKVFFKQFKLNMADLIKAGKVVPVKCDHADVSKFADMPDMVFIDGDHSYDSVKRDIRNWLDKIKPGGLICGHDASQGQVLQAVRDIFPDAAIAIGTTIWFKYV